MNTTPNLGLKKPGQTDFYNVDDFNQNADILDAEVTKRMVNAGGVPSAQAGTDASKPAPGIAGRLYIATDTQIIYRDTGTAWDKVGVVNWNDIAGKPTSFTPSTHASTHASGGSDPITPAMIGAVNKSGDTMTGALNFGNTSHLITSLGSGLKIVGGGFLHSTGRNNGILGANVEYDGANWNRIDTLKNSSLLEVIGGSLRFYSVTSGPNPITWGEIYNVWHSGNLMTTADITYYVNSTSGNDANNGLSAATAFKTIQKAIASTPRFVDHTVTIQLADGTYNETVSVNGFVGRGSIVIQGNVTTPTNVKVTAFDVISNTCYIKISYLEITAASRNAINISYSSNTRINNVTIQTSNNSNYGIYAIYSKVFVSYSTISNRYIALASMFISHIFSSYNSGSGNTYGLYASRGSVIAKESSQPTGTTNEYTETGGVIR